MLLAAAPHASQGSELEKVAACGQPGTQAWLCSTVYDLTGSQQAAEVADDLAPLFNMLVIFVVAYVAVMVARRVIKRVVRKLAQEETGHRISRLKAKTGISLLETSAVPSARRALRAETIGAVLRSVVTALVWTTAVLMVLEELNVNLAAIGVGAGIIGVAIGFGSQSLVKDFLSGLFMLVEDQYGVGDVIDADVASGTVEGVSLRTTRLRDVEGTVWHVPNGEIRRVGNKSQQWSRALLDVAVAYDVDLDRAVSVVKAAADAVWRDPAYARVILEEPEVWGAEQVTAEQILIRLVVKTKPLEQWRVARELRARLKVALDDAGIDRSFQPVVTFRAEGRVPPGR